MPRGGFDFANPVCNYTVIDTSDNTVTVCDGPAVVYGVYVNTVLSAATVVIQDGSTAIMTLPASLAAGSERDLKGVRVSSLIVNPDDASTGNITVFWAPQ